MIYQQITLRHCAEEREREILAPRQLTVDGHINLLLLSDSLLAIVVVR